MTEPVYDIEEDFSHTHVAAEQLERGQRVRLRYLPSDGSVEENPREDHDIEERTGTVKKTVCSSIGNTVFIHFDVGASNGMVWKLHDVPGGTITGTNPYGSRTVRKGLDGRVKAIEEGDQ